MNISVDWYGNLLKVGDTVQDTRNGDPGVIVDIPDLSADGDMRRLEVEWQELEETYIMPIDSRDVEKVYV